MMLLREDQTENELSLSITNLKTNSGLEEKQTSPESFDTHL